MRSVAVWGVSESERGPWGKVLVVFFGYSLLIYVIGTVIVLRLPWGFTRVDLMMAVCVEIAGRFPIWVSLLWCFLWGYVSDVFQGRLWGLHGAAYLMVVYLHRLWSSQMDVWSLWYRALLVGLGIALQGVAAAVIVNGGPEMTRVFITTAGQALFSIMVSPFVMAPIPWILGEKDR